MSTPTKRRKINNYKSSPKTIGSIEYFFGKHKDDPISNNRDEHAPCETVENVASQDESKTAKKPQTLTDEQYARKLQIEWDEQDKAHNGQANETDEKGVEGQDADRHDRKGPTIGSGAAWPSLMIPAGIATAEKGNVQVQEPHSNSVGGKKDTLSLQSTASAGSTVVSIVPFDDNPLIFDPSKYILELRDQWAELGGDASYGILTRCFILVNSTQSRIKIVDTLVNFLRILIEGDPDSLLPAVSFIIGIPLCVLII